MLWIKALHIIAVICWFAGIFYLPRLFVYHAMSEHQQTREQLQLMQHKLYRFMSMFAVLTLLFGSWLASYNLSYYLASSWFIIKLVCVAALVAYHLICGYFVQQLQAGNSQHSHVFFRWFNELPVVIMFAVVILVVVKPFS
jgi:putative membrane protein